jgi:ribosomal protein S18 acetylase RimI-like enzyme
MASGETVAVRDLGSDDLAWAEALLGREFGGRVQAIRGELVDVLDADALVAELRGERVGLLCYRVAVTSCEIEALAATQPGAGVGTALVEALRARVGTLPIRVVTTNDNLRALRFYQRRGFRLAELRPGAVDDARRRLKPSIAEIGDDGIPLRDELELVLD